MGMVPGLGQCNADKSLPEDSESCQYLSSPVSKIDLIGPVVSIGRGWKASGRRAGLKRRASSPG
jgi:hypothetical protein